MIPIRYSDGLTRREAVVGVAAAGDSQLKNSPNPFSRPRSPDLVAMEPGQGQQDKVRVKGDA